ncbi:BolA/IbaG family iron-sulfur metabolism protein [Halobacteriovorax sp. DA5]|uniref:BolA/IbaG family iron-sulfur metabolism protein n=1 Tax=Halobacteriovorax sp. DA5 TaxID=2067553 RepID=UPI000CD02B9A|nr:BolA/IbaG family iron-sulfur metabolism protein [Halobacteriovorax sp. DA5]POB15295.1 BolA family transcriptional regulator [Halobacteriovorax sp. DA5]
MLFEQVKTIIEENIKDSQVMIYDLTGGGDHLGITIVSDEFKGKMLLAQHRMVMDILKQKLSEDLHAVQLKTLTFEQAKNQGLI